MINMASERNMALEHEKVVDVKVIDDDQDEVVHTQDFTAPEDLFKQLIARIKKYHPSTDISQMKRRIKSQIWHIKDSFANPGSRILSIR